MATSGKKSKEKKQSHFSTKENIPEQTVEDLQRELLAAKGQLHAMQEELQQCRSKKGTPSSAREQKNLKHKQARLQCIRELLEHNADFAALIAPDGQTLYINSALKKVAKIHARKKISSVNIFEWYSPEEHAKITEIVIPHTLQYGFWKGETEVVIDQETISVFQQCSLHRDEEGSPEFIVILMRDTRTERDAHQVQIAEERWRYAFEGNDDGVWDWNVQESTVFFSKRWKEMLGYDEGDVGNALEDWSLRVHPDDIADTLRELQEYLDGKIDAYRKEYRMQCKDGTYIWVFDRGKVIERTSDGKPLRMVGTYTNINERRQVEEQLRHSEKRLRAISEAVSVGIFLGTPDGQAAYVNPMCEELCGVDSGEGLGFKWSVYLHPDDKEDVFAKWTESTRAGTTFNAEYRFLHRNGRLVYVQGKAEPMKDGEEVIGYVGILEDMTERKAMEDTLRESEQRLRAIVQSEPECVKIVGRKCELIDMNPAGLVMIEADSFEQVAGSFVPGLIQPEYRKAFEELNNRVFAGETAMLEFELQGLKGGRRWMETHASPLRDEHGNVTAHLAVTRDITDRKHAEEQLRQSEARFRTISEASPLGIFVKNPDGECIYTNKVYQHLSGLSIEQTLGSGWQQAIHPDDKARLFAAVVKSMQQEILLTEEVRFVHADGTIVWIHVKASAMHDGNALLGYVGVVEDITERKEATEKLRKMEERWQFAIEGSGDGAWDWDIQANTVFFSNRWKEMLGYEPHEIGNTKDEWALRIHQDDIEWVLTVLNQYLQGQISVYKVEFRMRCKDGSYKWILARGKVIERDVNDSPLRMVGTHADITERKTVEEQMLHSEERFRAMSDASPLGIFVTDARGNCEYTNKVYHRISGLTLEETLGSGWSNAIHAEDRTRVFGEWYHAAAQDVSFESSHRFQRPDGTIVWTRVKAEAMRDGADILGYIGVVEDITRRKQAEQELYETLTLQKAILDGTQHCILSVDSNGIIRMANAAAERMLGYSVEEMLGQTLAFLHVPEEVVERTKIVSKELEKSVQPERDVFVVKAELYGYEESEWSYIRKNGTRFTARVFVAAMHNSAGVLTGFLVMGLDITEQKAAEQVIQRQNQMLDGILANLPVIAYRVDENKCFTEIRGSALQRFGAKEEDLLEHSVTELFPLLSDVFDRVYEGEVAVGEYSGVYKNEGWCFDNYLFADQHQRHHLIGFAFDTTERKVAEEEVHRSQANLSAVFNSTNDAIWAINADQQLIAYNESFAQYVLITEGIAVATGMHITELLSGSALQHWSVLYGQVLAGEEFIYNMDAIVHNKRRYFEITFSPIRYSHSVTGAVMFSKNMTDHKIAEELLVEKLAMLNSVLESTDSIIYAVSTEYEYLAFNSMYRNMVQAVYGVDVSIGESALDIFMMSSDGEKIMARLERAMREGQFIVVEEFGDTEWTKSYYEISFYPIRTEMGGIIGVAAYMRDITERKHNEEALRRTTVLQTAILDGADVSIISTDTQGVIQTFNKAAERLLGYAAEEVVGKETPAIIHDAAEVVRRTEVLCKEWGIDIEPGFETFVAKARVERVDENEWTYIRKNGERFPILLSVTALRDADENITGFLGIGVDITERKHSEALLLKTQEALLGAQRIAKTGSYEIDLIADKKVWTEQAAIIFGFDVATPMDSIDILSFTHPDDASMVTRAWQRMLGYGAVFNFDYRIVRSNGNVVYVNSFGKPVFDNSGNIVAILGTVQDISERKKYEQELITARDAADSANRAKSEFLANMSHEIRTPMNAVLGFSELLQNAIVEPQQKMYIKAILDSGKVLLTLINDILDLSKIEAGRLEFSYELEDVNTLVSEIQQIFSVRTREKGIDLIVDSKVSDRFIVDPTRLRQVLLNVVGNAVKFTDSGFVRILVTEKLVAEEIRALHVAIEDTGIGIPSDQQEIIFEAFRQQDGQSTRKYGGTGLGLSITKRLVEAMNGSITVYSEVAKGSTFEIVLPEAALSTQWINTTTGEFEGEHEDNNTDVLDFGGALLVVADDVELNRTLLREMLSENNVRIIECQNGKETVETVLHYKPDVVLMDLRMPDMNGYEAALRIRSTPEVEKTPIAFLSASAIQEELFTQVLEKETFLYKPVSRNELLTLLSNVLSYTTVAGSNTHTSTHLEQEEGDPETWRCEISKEELAVLPQLLQVLYTECMPVWIEINDAPIMDEVEVFAHKLQQVAQQYNVRMLEQYSEVLLYQVRTVDVLSFPETLAQFSEIIHVMEKIRDDSNSTTAGENT